MQTLSLEHSLCYSLPPLFLLRLKTELQSFAISPRIVWQLKTAVSTDVNRHFINSSFLSSCSSPWKCQDLRKPLMLYSICLMVHWYLITVCNSVSPFAFDFSALARPPVTHSHLSFITWQINMLAPVSTSFTWGQFHHSSGAQFALSHKKQVTHFHARESRCAVVYN